MQKGSFARGLKLGKTLNLFVFDTDPDDNWIEISGELETIYDRETID